MNKIVNGVANDYEFPQLDWVHHDSTTIKMPSDEETTNLAKAIWNYFPLLVEENKTLKQELQRKDNVIKQTIGTIKELIDDSEDTTCYEITNTVKKLLLEELETGRSDE